MQLMSGDTAVTDTAASLESILKPVSEQLSLVRKRVADALPPEQKLASILPALRHVLGKRGKYLRPALVLLSCGLCGADPNSALEYAAIAELIHIGSLVFDDLLDGSELRRGRKTINALWGDKTAFLTGTHLLLEVGNRTAFESTPVRDVLMRTLNSMFQGEVLQFESHQDFSLDEETYMEIIAAKTASFISACCRLGALAAGDTGHEEMMGRFGIEVGTAFQIRDDVLDLVAKDPSKLGKKLGSDLRDARMTLPFIHFARSAARSERRYLKSVFGSNNGKKSDLKRVGELMESTGSISYAMGKARAFAEKAASRLEAFGHPQAHAGSVEPYKLALKCFCRFACEREY